MSKPGEVAVEAPADPETVAPVTPARAVPELRTGSALILAGIGLFWVAATLGSLRGTIARYADADSAVMDAAPLLYIPITTALALGVAAGLFTSLKLAERRQLSPVVRVVAGAAGGLLAALVAAGLTALLIKENRIAAVALLSLGAAAIIGGALAAVRPARVLAAGVTGLYGMFIANVLLQLFQSKLTSSFGSGNTIDAQHTASQRVMLFTALLAGIVSGVVAFRYLAFGARRSGVTYRWPAYLAAGGFAGLTSLVAIGFNQIAGRVMLTKVAGMGGLIGDLMTIDLRSRLPEGMVLFFAGSLAAMIAYGRTLKPRRREVTEPETDPEAD
ncbi:hypothetical protein [Longispora albida]|uniref:hypothetical protein n=1 Tax=Longispora albida TaxID=203523 RepID=UPI00036526CD|nr:hypothetical protein [Longispora albida]